MAIVNTWVYPKIVDDIWLSERYYQEDNDWKAWYLAALSSMGVKLNWTAPNIDWIFDTNYMNEEPKTDT